MDSFLNSARVENSNASSSTMIRLTPNESSNIERRLLLRPGRSFPIGRASKANSAKTQPDTSNAYFDCPVISRQHAELSLVDPVSRGSSYVTITDLASMHGTFVNGKAITQHESYELHNGDVIRLGSSVSRGADYYRGISVTFNYDRAASPDLATGSRTFSVPAVTDDEDSLYASENESVFDGAAFSSSPQTSPPAEALDGTPEKPITIDDQVRGSLRSIVDLVDSAEDPKVDFVPNVPVEVVEVQEQLTSVPEPCEEHSSLESEPPAEDVVGGLRKLIRDLQDTEDAAAQTFGWHSWSDASTAQRTIHPPTVSDPTHGAITESAVEQDGMRGLSYIPLSHQAPLFQASVPVAAYDGDGTTQSMQPSNKMAITNMLASPAQETTAPAITILDDLPAKVTAIQPTSTNTPTPLPDITKTKKRKQCVMDYDPFANLNIDDLLVGLGPSPPKRRRKIARGRASTFMRESGKYTFGAAVGAMGTFAFLASPLGGHFADWLSSL